MSGTGDIPRRRRLWRWLLGVAAFLMLLTSLAVWYTTTTLFQDMVRRRMVGELERITGGRVELGGIHTIPFRFQVEVRDLIIHGREAPGEAPYVRVDSVVAQVKVISVIGVVMGFRSLVFERPVVHIAWYADGSTNQPSPKKAKLSSGAEKLFALSVDSLAVRNGELLWKDQKIPLDFVARDVASDLTYSFLHRRYDGNILLGKVDTTFDGYRPFAWMLEGHFALGHGGLAVKSLRATSGRSTLEASGHLENFREPKAQGTYKISLDLGEAAAIARNMQVRRGVLQADGNGTWGRSDFSAAGKLNVRDLDWRDQMVKLKNAGGSSDFSGTGQKLTLTHLEARLLGGNVGGDADIFDWTGSTPVQRSKSKTPAESRSVVRLSCKELSLQEIAAALSSPGRPFERAKLAGSVGGTVESRWRGKVSNAQTEFAFDVAAPSQVKAGQLPVNAHGHGSYDLAQDELKVEEFEASTRATQLHASGTLSRHAAMKLTVTTNDLQEWQPVLSALGYDEPIPIRLRGGASFRGNASGRITDVLFSGSMQSRDFEVLAGEKESHWDSLVADIQLSPHIFAAHNGSLHSGSASITFDFSGALQERRFNDASLFQARMEVHDAEIEKIQALAGWDYPITGFMNLRLQVSGTRSLPEGQGEIELSHAVIFGRTLQTCEAKLALAGPRIDLADFRATQGEATVLGSASYDRDARSFRFNFNGANFELAQVSQLQNKHWQLGGRVDFNAQGHGTLDAPQFETHIQVRELAVDQNPLGSFDFDATTQGPELRLTGHSQFRDSQLEVNGEIQTRGEWPGKINLTFRQLNVSPLIQGYVKGKLIGTSVATGGVQLSGPIRTPRELALTGDLSSLSTEVEGIAVRNSGPLRFAAAGQWLSLQPAHLVGENTDLALEGRLQLNGNHQIELRANGHANLALIHSFDADFRTSGGVEIDMSASGPARKPVLQGRLQVSNGAIAYKDLPNALSEINGSLALRRDRLQIETLTARVGGGTVSAGGYATLYKRQLNFDLTLQTQDVRLRYPPGVSSMTNAALRFAGTPAASTLSGDITITKLAITPGFDFGAYLQRSAQTSVLPQTDPVLSRIRLDVHFTTTPELQMQTAVVRFSGDADLRLRGTAAKPVLLGRADILEGQVYVNGAKYRMERGEVTFTNPVTTTPVLDLQATTRVRDYDISVNLNGELDKLNMSYHSEPPLPTADIINLLALGQTQQQSAQLQSVQSPLAQQASSAVLAEALNSALSNRSQRLFGISHIKIDPQGLNTETAPTQTTPAVTIEQQVRDNLTLTYTTNVSQTSQQIIQGEYNITRDLSILGIRDYNGVVSFEVRLRRRRR